MNIKVDLETGHNKERRIYKRVDFHQPVQFRFVNPPRTSGCLSCDLSEGGLRVNINEFVPLGTELGLQVLLAAQKIVEFAGRVAWVTKVPFSDRYQLGLEFSKDKMFWVAKNEINQFINRQL